MNQEVKAEVAVTDLTHAIELIMSWHAMTVAQVTHMLNIPEGTTVDIEGQDPLQLSGDTLRGYRLGIEIALADLGKLPFRAEYTEEDAPTH